MPEKSTPFYGLSPSARAELYRAAGNVRSCDSCVSWLPLAFRIVLEHRVEMNCAKHMPACQPGHGRVCDFYERAPGSD